MNHDPEKFEVSFGLGMNLLKYDQVTDAPTDYRLTSIEVPAVYLSGEWHYNENWNFLGTFNVAPGRGTYKGVSGQTLESTYQWTIFAAETLYSNPNWEYILSSKTKLKLYALGGMQHHITPFLARKNTAEQEVSIKTDTNL